jgi:hypothetical protein
VLRREKSRCAAAGNPRVTASSKRSVLTADCNPSVLSAQSVVLEHCGNVAGENLNVPCRNYPPCDGVINVYCHSYSRDIIVVLS